MEISGMQGNENAADYTRKYVPQGRWRDTWEVFKSNFFKLILLNIFVLITFVPGIVLVFFRNSYVAGLSTEYYFNRSVLFTAPPSGYVTGLAERLVLSADVLFYSLLIVAGFIASVGISGAVYCIRKMLLTRGEFNIKNFFHGIKVGYFNTVLPLTLFLLFLYGVFVVGDWMHLTIATGGNGAAAITAYVFIIIATVLAGLYLAWLFAVGVSYHVKMKFLFKNSFVFLIGMPIQTIFMAGFCLIPVWFFMMGGFWQIISYVLFVFIGFSFMLLCWMSYAQWAFDAYITPNVKAEKEAARAKKSEKELAEEAADEAKQQALELLAAGKSELIAHPIMPIAEEVAVQPLGVTFTRASLSKAHESRQKLGSDISAYERAHENDEVYVQYNKMFAEREKALTEPQGKKSKRSKKISADNLLRGN